MKYHFNFALKSGLQPREYPLTLRFAAPDGERDPNYKEPLLPFTLYVGVKEGGLLIVEPQQQKDGPAQATGGREKLFTLELKNNYPDYDVNIRQVMVDSNVDGLIAEIVDVEPKGSLNQRGHTINFDDEPFSIEPGQRKELRVRVRLGGLRAAGSPITGFPGDAQIDFKFDYDDGKERRLSDFRHSVPLLVSPSRTVLVIAVMLGVAVAVFLMSVWKVVKYEGSGKQRLLLVVSTVLIGLIATVMATQGQLNVSLDALQLRASHDMPISLCLLSLFATMSGTPMLKKFFGVDKSADGGAAAPTAAASTGGSR
jgi:hypothetical protein